MMRLFLSLLFTCNALFAEDIASLLSAINQKADLSKQTKKESIGEVSTFTRADLDRMQIRSLKELIDYVPYMRYNEDAYGFASAGYVPYQPEPTYMLRIYINDRELMTPFNGSLLNVAMGINLSFIDHVEIYSGVPSYQFGIAQSIISIRLYTKDPSREETNLVGLLGGSYGSSDLYGYSAKSYEDLSYLLYINKRKWNRKDIHTNTSSLSRDAGNVDVFGQINIPNHRFEVHAMDGRIDNFIGTSFTISPDENKMDYRYISSEWHYYSDDESLKTSLGYLSTSVRRKESIFDNMPFSSLYYRVDDELLRLHVTKTWEDEKNTLLLGLRGEYKTFDIKDININGVVNNNRYAYDKELISVAYMEATHMLDDEHMLTASAQVSNYERNGEINDVNLYSGRLGYIYNSGDWTSKSYFYYGEHTQNPSLHISNLDNVGTDILKKESAKAFLTTLTYKQENWQTSVQIGQTRFNDLVYFFGTENRYQNFDGTTTNSFAQWNFRYDFDPMNSLITNVWYYNSLMKGEGVKQHNDYLNTYVTLMNTFGKWDFTNSLVLYELDYANNNGAGLNYNAAITYRHNRNLQFFLKGMNLFEEALTTDYYRINPIDGTRTELNDVNVYDRRIMFGVEYQF